MKTEIVKIRLNAATYLKYLNAARLNQMPLSTYLRTKLEQSEDVISELGELKSAIYDLRLRSVEQAQDNPKIDTKQNDQDDSLKSAADPLLIELVLLLRGLVRPDHMNMVHGELRRQGFDVFSVVT